MKREDYKRANSHSSKNRNPTIHTNYKKMYVL